MTAGYRNHPDAVVGLARDVHVLGHYLLVGGIVAASAALAPVIEAAARTQTAPSAAGLAVDGFALVVVALAAMSLRFGAPLLRTVAVVTPALVLLAVTAVVRTHVSPLTVSVLMAAALISAAAAQRFA
jgi:hypothetical protein